MKPRYVVAAVAVALGLVLFAVGQSAVAVAVLAAGALVLVFRSGSRYDRRPAPGGDSSPRAMWESLDAGDDPTTGPDTDPDHST